MGALPTETEPTKGGSEGNTEANSEDELEGNGGVDAAETTRGGAPLAFEDNPYPFSFTWSDQDC